MIQPHQQERKFEPVSTTLPSTFNDFLGNSTAVEHLRTAIAAGRLPHSLILAGPTGAGKYTLALMLTMAVECERQPRELRSSSEALGANGQSLASFCGVCHNCTRIASAANLEDEVDKAVAVREELRDADKKDTRILIQPHPDVLIVPPDPPQLLIKLGQIRTVIQRSHYLPSEAPKRIFILTAASFMKEAANSLLKILEEPPDTVHLIILAENPGELLPTIRSRCATVRLGALPVEEIEMLLADRRQDVPPQQRTLIARLAQGAAALISPPTPPPAPTPSSSSATPPQPTPATPSPGPPASLLAGVENPTTPPSSR